ncbi:MAG: glutamine synthetase III [Christensenella sp.]|nr:glutamine synthetase III [Christensenella sp.]
MAIKDIFGSLVFNDETMKEMLSDETYSKLQECIKNKTSITLDIANEVAEAMKYWAIKHGCTHFTHWFQPMTGITAEKHDSFIGTKNGELIMEFRGKELVKGEPDASSFPSGGVRATFEARGYTAWDPTSYAFIKDKTLCIPTAFCSYTGEALDKKTPLLKSINALNIQAKRILKLFGKDVDNVCSTVGSEQEYFLIDKSVYKKRPDLVYTGRTLFGATASKGQELEDHYFGTIKERVQKFMEELDEELWKLGVYAKTEHNEVAPAQHELAPIFCETNLATDQNQLTMEMMKKIAAHHDMACLLHEKPFKGVNGSGKHNNWSLSTSTGENLLDPGETPEDNLQFLLFLTAVITAVDEYQDIMRMSVATAGNDHRLGANEAPPAIVSVFLGEELTGILDAIADGRTYSKRAKCFFEMGVDVLPKFIKDTTDRNRTSPFAFTGNKFEFRMPGSSLSIAGPNIIINTAVAEILCRFADTLEKSTNFDQAVKDIIKENINDHKRIIFNGNSYDVSWEKEAAKRGLLNLRSAPEAIFQFKAQKNIDLFVKHNVFTPFEVKSRADIMLENYSKIIEIEATTMVEMVKKDILPAVTLYINDLMTSLINAKTLGLDMNMSAQKHILERLNNLYNSTVEKTEKLEEVKIATTKIKEIDKQALSCRKKLFTAMEELREDVDAMETITSSKYWPYPSYGEILFSIR